MYTLSSRRSHIVIVAVNFLHQEPAITMGNPITALDSGELTQVSRLTNVHLSFWISHLGIVAVDYLHQEPARTVGEPFTAYVSGEVAQVSRMTNVHPKFLEKSHR